MWKQTTIIVIALVASISLDATAQGKDSHLEAARSFMRTFGIKERMTQSFKPLVKEIKGFQGIDWSKLETKLAQVYMKSLTELELREMTAFFKTPTGKKYASMSHLPKELNVVQTQFFVEHFSKNMGLGPIGQPADSTGQLMESLERQDEKAAAFGIGVLRSLEADDLAQAKRGLAIAVGSYYIRHLDKDASKLKGMELTMKKSIEALMQKSEALKQYIADRKKK